MISCSCIIVTDPKRDRIPDSGFDILLKLRLTSTTMSIRLPPPDNISGRLNSDSEESSASSDDENDETWDDWVSDSNTRQGCKSLFDEKILSCVEDAVTYDYENYKVNINELCKRLCKFH